MINTQQKCSQCGRIIFFEGLCDWCQRENERNRILALSAEEIAQEIEEICNEINEDGIVQLQYEKFFGLLNYRDIDTSKIAETAFKKQLFCPPELYCSASDETIKAMIEKVKEDDLEINFLNELLLCLAVNGSKEVIETFLELEKNPRKWREKLYEDLSEYAVYGGWCYDENGTVFLTNFQTCYPIVRGTLEEKENSPVKIGTETKQRCENCGCQIVNLMEIDGTQPRLDFLGINGVIKAACCPNCIPYSGSSFCRYTINGESEIILNEECEFEPDSMEDEEMEKFMHNELVLGKNPVPLRYAANWDSGSAVGGFAFWISGAQIEKCPDCKKRMKYFAQIQWDTVFEWSEGNAYLEICTDCHIIGIFHQQT